MKVIVCGSRGITNKERIYSVIRELPEGSLVATGGNGYIGRMACKTEADLLKADRGADALAYQCAHYMGFEKPVFWAFWHVGHKAGPQRNARMLKEIRPDKVIAFPEQQSRGTRDMIKKAKDAGVPVEIY